MTRRLADTGRRRAAALLIVASLGCARSGALGDADCIAIRQLDSTYVDAWLRDDTAAVLATLTPDAVLLPAGQRPLTGLDAIRDFWWPSDGSRTHVTAYATTIDEIGGDANLAYVRGTGVLQFTYEKDSVRTQAEAHNMTLTIVERGADGRWRIARRMWGPLVR